MTGDDIRQTLARNIRTLRKARQLAQEELSSMADISVPFLSDIERGNKWPHPETRSKLSSSLGICVYELFLSDDVPITGEGMQAFLQEISAAAAAAVKSVIEKHIMATTGTSL